MTTALLSRLAAQLRLDLHHDDDDERGEAFARLGALPGDPVDALAPFLVDPEPLFREVAALNLARARLPHAWPHLVAALERERDEEVQGCLVLALRPYSDPRILDVLSPRIANPKLRPVIHLQLWRYPAEIVLPLLHTAKREPVADLVRDIVRHGAGDVRAHLLAELDADDFVPHRIALTLLSHDDHAETRRAAIPKVVALLGHPTHYIRSMACEYLAAVRAAQAIPALLSVVRDDPSPDTSAIAVRALDSFHDEAIADALLTLLESGVQDLRRAAALMQLWKYPSARTVALLDSLMAPRMEVEEYRLIHSARDFFERLEATP